MNANVRMLPRLNLCYLQKKAFENHRRNMNRIKSSLETSTRREFYGSDHIMPSKKVNPHRLNTISDEIVTKPERSIHMTPLQKKMRYQTEKQNHRLYLAINKCRPTISRRQIGKHSIKSHDDLDRMAKFQVDPFSNRKILKSRLSLEKICSLQKTRNSRVVSRLIPACPTTSSKSKLENQNIKIELQKDEENNAKNFKRSLSTREEHFKSLIKKQIRKIKHHFEDKQFQLITENRLKLYREKAESSSSFNMLSPQVHKWKTRCFTTQMQVYE